jgi:hypothetical protein
VAIGVQTREEMLASWRAKIDDQRASLQLWREGESVFSVNGGDETAGLMSRLEANIAELESLVAYIENGGGVS